MTRGRVSENYGRRASASEVSGTVLSVVGLVLYTGIGWILAALPGISFIPCSENPGLCKAENFSSVLLTIGLCAAVLAVIVAVVLLAARRAGTWRVIAVAAGLVTICFVTAAIVELKNNT